MNEKEIQGVLLIFTVNGRSVNPKLKQIVHFASFVLFQLYILLELYGATFLGGSIKFFGRARNRYEWREHFYFYDVTEI